jgi:alkanesulfonate monooxygenase SsuD/methylene tetrahydromethanopterin reductase-like flavin-dependent oxidoreductase (luciferase family)
VTVPTIRRILASHGRSAEKFRMVGMPFVALGETEEALAAAILGAKNQIAFYASTPAYKSVLDLHGWGDIQPEMLRLSKLGRWQEMGTLVGDDMLNAFCIVGNSAACARELTRRFHGIFDLIGGYTNAGPGLPNEILTELRKLAKAPG